MFRVTTYLEMKEPREHRRKACADPGFTVQEERDWRVNREMNAGVGAQYHWPMGWTEDHWKAWADNPSVRTWIACKDGGKAGYFELQKHEAGNVELVRFGLLPAFIGHGLGGPLLSVMIDEAWRWGATRIWFHTCSLDHPSALPNYLARGFRIFKRVEEDLP